MINTGNELQTFITGLNAEATIDLTLLDVLVDNAKTVLEEERPWMCLRKTDTSKTVTAGNTWQTAIDLSTISDFSRFYMNQDGVVIKLFDGDNRVDYITLKSYDQRLEYKDVSGTAVYDANSKQLYINGRVAFAGTLYIPYMATSPAIDLTVDTAVWTNFPSRFLPLLGYYAMKIYAQGVDYDSIASNQAIGHNEMMKSLKDAMVRWDNELQLNAIQSNDPSEYPGGYPRLGSVNRYEQ
jgi:hypothetical protein